MNGEKEKTILIILGFNVPYLVSKRKSYLSRQYFIPFQLMEVLADTAPSHCLANWPFLGLGLLGDIDPDLFIYIYIWRQLISRRPGCCTQSVRRVPCGW